MSSKFNVRDFFWNYPKFFSDLIKITNPFFSILLALLLGVFLFSLLTSNLVRHLVDSRDNNKVIEGVVGSLLSTNPMYLTENSVDRDFYKLIYEKLIEVDVNGDPVANLALEWEEKEDLEYILKLRNDVFWHDGQPFTADDVVWNFKTAMLLAQDFGEETYGSALEGVDVKKIDKYTVHFILPETNATFWEAISVYLIPKHIYDVYPVESFALTKTNTHPIGCGLFAVNTISKKGFALSVFEKHWKQSNIKSYKYIFFEDYVSLNNALKNNEVDIITTYDINQVDNVEDYPFFRLESTTLFNRQKLIYFNTRKEKYRDSAFRDAITMLVNKEKLFELSDMDVEIAAGPISPKSWAFNDSVNFLEYNPESAGEILKSLGFVKDLQGEFYVTKEDEKILSIELSYFENDFNTNLVKNLEGLLRDEGVLLRLKPLTYEQILREILPTRDFELLLYEIEVTLDPDQYNLWHSLRIDHPMLNISGYDYSRVDILLERARTNLDVEKRKEDYFLFQRYLVDDSPVISLYHPRVFFLLRKSLKGFDAGDLVNPSDRYENIDKWDWN